MLSYPVHNLVKFEKSPLYMGIKIYNKINQSTKQLNNIQFSNLLKDILMEKAYYSIKKMLEDKDFN